MMRLLRYVVQGFGWEVGRKAAREAIDEAAEALDGAAPTPPDPKAEARAATKRAREAAKRRRAEAREAKRREQAVEDELRAMKKRVDRD
jgi:hypothetical protein